MSGHSNHTIQKHIESSQELLKKLNDLKSELSSNIMSQFQTDMGVPFPNIKEADVRILDYALVYSSDPNIDEYVTGAKGVLDAAIGEDYPAIANKALDIVSVVARQVIGSGNIGIGLASDSAKIHDKGGKVFISACYSLVEQCSASNWATQTDFYISHYLFVVWEPNAQSFSIATPKRTIK